MNRTITIYQTEKKMELLDIRRPDGSLSGTSMEREKVHEQGLLHGTSHVWIVRKNQKNEWEILLQKRARDKDAFPGCYDISSAGHIPAGQDYLESALRELEEELGIKAGEKDLVYIGMNEVYHEAIFYDKPFRNHEISKVYLYSGFVDADKLSLQKEEVESVRWMGLEECMKVLKTDPSGYCVPFRELEMIRDYLLSR